MDGTIIKRDGDYRALDGSGSCFARSSSLSNLKKNITSYVKDITKKSAIYVRFSENRWFTDDEIDIYSDKKFSWDSNISWIYQSGGDT